jgi:hypothetical protein
MAYHVVLDTRTTDICRGYSGVTLPMAEVQHIPPLHYQCRTELRPVLWFEDWKPVLPTEEPMQGFGGIPQIVNYLPRVPRRSAVRLVQEGLAE